MVGIFPLFRLTPVPNASARGAGEGGAIAGLQRGFSNEKATMAILSQCDNLNNVDAFRIKLSRASLKAGQLLKYLFAFYLSFASCCVINFSLRKSSFTFRRKIVRERESIMRQPRAAGAAQSALAKCISFATKCYINEFW